IYNWWSYAQNVPTYYHLYGKSTIKITENTFLNITLENRYITGRTVDMENNTVSDVSIYISGYTDFGDFYGWFESWTSSDEEGMFNVAVFISPNVNLMAHPPDPYAEYTTNIDATEDTSINIILQELVFVTVSGFVLDRDGNPVPNQWVYIGRSAVTDENGRFSINVPVGEYVIEIYNWWSYAQNVPTYYHLYGKSTIKITENTFLNITLENRYITGKVDCEGRPVANTDVDISGYADFGDFYGWFESWASSDTAGRFSVAIFTCPNVYLWVNPPEIYAPVQMYIDATNDKTVLIALSYKTGVLPTADFAWSPQTPEAGQIVTFDASPSVPGSGIIIRHKWSFGDGTYAVGKIVTHTYSSPGVYMVTLNVTNSKGLWSIIQKQIEVLGLPGAPIANFTYAPVNPIIGQIATFDASSSYDPDGTIVSYNWNFGDGYTAEGAIVTHSYVEEGNYKVTLTVVDNDGKSSTISRTVTVVRPTTPTIETSGLVVIAKSPVDLIIYDPDFYVISREYNEIPGAMYLEEDLNGDGSLDAYIIIPEPKIGQYLITVTPKSDANPSDTYTLEVSYGNIAFLLAENVPISDIPTEPYLIHTTTFVAPPTPTVITAEIDVDPDTLNLGSKGRWVTAYIEFPEGFDVADINVSTILLNSSVSVDFNAPITIGDYDNDSIPDLMIKFNRADVISYILANVNLTELYENRFMTVTLTITGKLNDGTLFQGSCAIEIILPMPRYGRFIQYT
ncbi:MAG: PKD domain-containing protein, partial [Candidatus Bathyarchaeia archaeon]